MMQDQEFSLRQYNENHYLKTVEWLNQSDMQKMFGLTYKVDITGHKAWLDNNPFIEVLALYIADEYVGNIVLSHQKKHFSSYLQIYIGEEKFRGKGRGKKFMQMCLEYCFTKLGINRVWLHVREYNIPALKLYSSLNFVDEGIERESIWTGTEFLNQVRMSILKSDYLGK